MICGINNITSSRKGTIDGKDPRINGSLTLSYRAKFQMYLFCVFQMLHRIEFATFFTVCLCPCTHLDTLAIFVSLEILLSQQRSFFSQISDVFFFSSTF